MPSGGAPLARLRSHTVNQRTGCIRSLLLVSQKMAINGENTPETMRKSHQELMPGSPFSNADSQQEFWRIAWPQIEGYA